MEQQSAPRFMTVTEVADIMRVSKMTVYRLIHGEGDGLPGLIIDIYGSTAVIQAHSLGMYRVNQTLRNIDAFFKAFGIKEGDKMYLAPEDRILVW